MANQTQVRVLKREEGPRFILLHLYLEGDATGDVVDFVLSDKADHEPQVDGRMAIDKIMPSLSGFDVVLSFGNLVDRPVWVVTPYSREQCFIDPPLKDEGGLDATNKLLMSTSGMTDIGDRGALIIRIRKG